MVWIAYPRSFPHARSSSSSFAIFQASGLISVTMWSVEFTSSMRAMYACETISSVCDGDGGRSHIDEVDAGKQFCLKPSSQFLSRRLHQHWKRGIGFAIVPRHQRRKRDNRLQKIQERHHSVEQYSDCGIDLTLRSGTGFLHYERWQTAVYTHSRAPGCCAIIHLHLHPSLSIRCRSCRSRRDARGDTHAKPNRLVETWMSC